jgi:hypothetical protein
MFHLNSAKQSWWRFLLLVPLILLTLYVLYFNQQPPAQSTEPINPVPVALSQQQLRPEMHSANQPIDVVREHLTFSPTLLPTSHPTSNPTASIPIPSTTDLPTAPSDTASPSMMLPSHRIAESDSPSSNDTLRPGDILVGYELTVTPTLRRLNLSELNSPNSEFNWTSIASVVRARIESSLYEPSVKSEIVACSRHLQDIGANASRNYREPDWGAYYSLDATHRLVTDYALGLTEQMKLFILVYNVHFWGSGSGEGSELRKAAVSICTLSPLIKLLGTLLWLLWLLWLLLLLLL